MKNIFLSIIIVSFNTRKLLRDCLLSIYKSFPSPVFEIIIVDNASTDGSPEMIESDFKEIKIIKNAENSGFAKANNQALRIARGKYFLLLNSDTVIKKGAIETLVGFMENHEGTAAVGPKVLNPDGTTQSKGYNFPSVTAAFLSLLRIQTILPKNITYQIFGRYYWNENDIRAVDWISGCCFMVRRDTVSKIGMLYEGLFFYGEEIEWCYRAHRSGFQVYYCPDATIIHYGGASNIDRGNQRIFEAKRILYKRCFGRSKGVSVSVIDMLSSLLSLVNSYLNKSSIEIKYLLRQNVKFNADLLKKLLFSKHYS